MIRPKKRNQPERMLHTAVARFLNVSLPSPQGFWFPVPNASRRLLHQAANMKRAGEFKAGVPDIMICWRGRLIAVELKYGKNKPTVAQREIHKEMMLSGAAVATCGTLDEVERFLSVLQIPLKGHVV